MHSDTGPSSKKIKLDDEEDDGLYEVSPDPAGTRQQCDPLFVPLHMISQWQEPQTTAQRVTVAVVLPSGIYSGDFKFRVVDDGDVLEFTVNWPKPLIDISYMHKKWLVQNISFTNHHPKFLGFESSLRKLRSNVLSNVSSVARIGLPITVQSTVDQSYNLAWKDDACRMVYIDLKAVEEDYAVQNNISIFEEV